MVHHSTFAKSITKLEYLCEVQQGTLCNSLFNCLGLQMINLKRENGDTRHADAKTQD